MKEMKSLGRGMAPAVAVAIAASAWLGTYNAQADGPPQKMGYSKPSINLTVTPDCTDGEVATGYIRIANTSSGEVKVEDVCITVYWQKGGGDWMLAEPQMFETMLAPGVVIPKDNCEHTFPYEVAFTAGCDAREFRVVVKVKLECRNDWFMDTKSFRYCEQQDEDSTCGNPSINLVVTPNCTMDGKMAAGCVRIANTSSGPVEIEAVLLTVYWQKGGGDWWLADPQSFDTMLVPGVVIPKDNCEYTHPYTVWFESGWGAQEFRIVAQIKLKGRNDWFQDIKSFRYCPPTCSDSYLAY